MNGTRRWCRLLLAALALSLPAPRPAIGQQFGPLVPLDVDTFGRGLPRVAADGSGSWVAAWSGPDLDFLPTDVFTARSQDGGLTWSLAQPIKPQGDDGEDLDPRVVSDEAGTWLAVWESHDPLGGTIGTDADVLAARSVDGGATWSGAVPVNADAATDAVRDGRPDIDTDGMGLWIAVWSDAGGVYAARSLDAGATWSAPATVDVTGSIAEPRIATDRAGQWIVVWPSSLHSSSRDIVASGSSDGGLSWSVPVVIDPIQSATEPDERPAIVSDRIGSWVVVWSHSGEIWSSRSTDGGATWAPRSILSLATLNQSPHIASDGPDAFLASWFHFPDGYFRRSVDGGVTWSTAVTLGGRHELTSDRAGTLIRAESGAQVAPGAFCADGRLGSIEGCDDGDLVGGDGCEATCSPTGCGDGAVTGVEGCDDANIAYGDCCSPACQAEPAGNPCADDGNVCTNESCDGAGSCEHPNNTAPCDDGSLCTVGDVCASGACAGEGMPQSGCFAPTVPGKGLLKIRSSSSSSLVWRWIKGEAFATPEVPIHDRFALCLYDGSASPQPRVRAESRTEICRTRPCWYELGGGTAGSVPLEYFDPDGEPDGLRRIRLNPGADGKTKISVQAKDENLELPPLPLVPPVRAQLVSEDGACWEATFSSPRVNDSMRWLANPD
jgi:cysteine-rich repeat protein